MQLIYNYVDILQYVHYLQINHMNMYESIAYASTDNIIHPY